jgi:carbon monoxide dehydrogenase subunit G
MINDMIHVEVTVRVKAPQDKVWEMLTDWESHSKWIPLTKVTVLEAGTSSRSNVGTVFVGRTGIGKFAFDDLMRVDRCVSPAEAGEDGKCWITKTGAHIKGSASFHVAKIEDNVSEIVWVENATLSSQLTNRYLAPLLSYFGRIAFKLSLNKFAKIVERSVV